MLLGETSLEAGEQDREGEHQEGMSLQASSASARHVNLAHMLPPTSLGVRARELGFTLLPPSQW